MVLLNKLVHRFNGRVVLTSFEEIWQAATILAEVVKSQLYTQPRFNLADEKIATTLRSVQVDEPSEGMLMPYAGLIEQLCSGT